VAWLLVALLAVGALVAGWRGGRAAFGVGMAIALVWMATAVVVATNVGDADGFFDCGIRCAAAQEVVVLVFFVGPVLLVVLLLGSLAGWLARRIGH